MRRSRVRSRVIFLLIVGSAIIVAIAIRPPVLPLSIEVAANPLAFDWVSKQAGLFNDEGRQVDGQRIQMQITSRDGIDIWQTGGGWSKGSHPVGWIPEGAFVLDYAREIDIDYESLSSSLAGTVLVWGIFADRADVLGPTFDWTVVQQAAVKESWATLGGKAEWGFVKPAFAFPQRNTSGWAVVLSAAAAFHRTNVVSDSSLTARDFQRWLEPVLQAVPDFGTLGQKPALTIASRGAPLADFALLPESEWLTHYRQITTRQAIRFFYPTYPFLFEMPLAIWSGPETTASQREALRQFADFLAHSPAQTKALDYGLRPVNMTLTSANAPLFSAANSAGIVLQLPSGTPITMPSRNGTLSVLSWFRAIRPS